MPIENESKYRVLCNGLMDLLIAYVGSEIEALRITGVIPRAMGVHPPSATDTVSDDDLDWVKYGLPKLMVRFPMVYALSLGIKSYGHALHDLGGQHMMQYARHDMCDRSKRITHGSQLIHDALTVEWHGIGDWR